MDAFWIVGGAVNKEIPIREPCGVGSYATTEANHGRYDGTSTSQKALNWPGQSDLGSQDGAAAGGSWVLFAQKRRWWWKLLWWSYFIWCSATLYCSYQHVDVLTNCQTCFPIGSHGISDVEYLPERWMENGIFLKVSFGSMDFFVSFGSFNDQLSPTWSKYGIQITFNLPSLKLTQPMKIPIEFLVNTIKMVDFPLEKLFHGYVSLQECNNYSTLYILNSWLWCTYYSSFSRQGPGLGVLYKNHMKPRTPRTPQGPLLGKMAVVKQAPWSWWFDGLMDLDGPFFFVGKSGAWMVVGKNHVKGSWMYILLMTYICIYVYPFTFLPTAPCG